MPYNITRGVGSSKGYGFTTSESVVIPSVVYDIPGTYTWTAPSYVTSVNVVAVGGGGGGISFISGGSSGAGGGLGWKNNIPVTPGATYTVVVGNGGLQLNSSGLYSGEQSYFLDPNLVSGKGGVGARTGGNSSAGGSYTGDNGGSGGNGGISVDGATLGGAGGAGGYTGNGGDGGNANNTSAPTPGSGGGGGGGGGSGATDASGAGGGVGIWGQGPDGLEGVGSTANGTSGQSGSGGFDGFGFTTGSYLFPADGKNYGGGGGSNDSITLGEAGNGGRGAVRLVYNSAQPSSFPSENVQNNVYDFNVFPVATKFQDNIDNVLDTYEATPTELVSYVDLRVKFIPSGASVVPPPFGSARTGFPAENISAVYQLDCNQALYLAIGEQADYQWLINNPQYVVMDILRAGRRYSIGGGASFAGTTTTNPINTTAQNALCVVIARLVYWSFTHDCLVEVRPLDYTRIFHTTTIPEIFTSIS